jgi:pseudouridine-5'-phosphate glycosidase
LSLSASLKSSEKIAATYLAQVKVGILSGILIANPVPEAFDIPLEEMDQYITAALNEALSKGIDGKELTPFLLGRIVELTEGQSLVTNRALALNNIQLGAEIAVKLSELT